MPCVLVAVLLAVLLSPGSAWAEVCDGTWSVQPAPPSPFPDGSYSLTGVAATGSGEVWTVGQAIDTDVGQAVGVVARRSAGGRWTSQTFPDVALTAVAARPGDAWALGSRAGRSVVLHNVGRIWQELAVVPEGWQLSDVALTSATNVWFSGTARRGATTSPAALRFDGARWHRDVLGGAGSAAAIAVARKGDVWVVGQSARDGSSAWLPTTWHLEARRWRQEPVPDVPGTVAGLTDVVAHPGGTVWAIGSFSVSCCNYVSRPLRHDRDGWHDASTPGRDENGHATVLHVGPAAREAVIAGNTSQGDGGDPDTRPLLRRWTEGVWVPQPVEGLDDPQGSYLTAVDGDGRGATWAVGIRDGRPLVLRQCGVGS